MRTDTSIVAPNKEGIPWWNVISKTGSPKIIVTLRFEQRRNLGPRCSQAGHLNEHVNDRFGGESRYGGAAEVFNAPEKPCRDTRAKMRSLTSKQLQPANVVRLNRDILVDCSLHALSECIHFRERLSLAEQLIII